MRIASIDIGTNTVLLFIAEISQPKNIIKSILNEYRVPRIGRNISSSGIIGADEYSRLFEVLKEYRSISLAAGCQTILVNGTYPFRTAANADEIRNNIQTALNLDTRTLSPDEEAGYSFLGATYANSGSDTIAVIDIGGGSTEISIGTGKLLAYKKSVPIGAVNISERYFSSAEISNSESGFEQEVKNELQRGFQTGEIVRTAYAIAGTPTTLACMKANMLTFDEDKIDKSILTFDEVASFCELLKHLTPTLIRERFGEVTAGREDVLYAGTAILRELMNIFHFTQVEVSSKGLRHGALYDYVFRTFGRYFELA